MFLLGSSSSLSFPRLLYFVLPFVVCTKQWSSRPLVSRLPPPRLAPCSRHLLAEYVPNDSELRESENLEIIGEDPKEGSLSTDTIPVRIITEFSVFDVKTRQLVALRSLLAPRDSPELSSYCVAGYVLPAMEDAISNADSILDLDVEDCQYMTLSTISHMESLYFNGEHEFLERYGL